MEANSNSAIVFFVNGKKIIDSDIDPEWTLLFYLRNKLRLCGTKLGCAEGGCGACTVMVSKYDRNKNKLNHLAVNACLAPVCSMHGLAVTTVEGIGSTRTRLHPVQERIAKAHGSQCGFCTPGIVMSMYTLLRNSPKPSMKELEVAFQGNLCRCTGYRSIIEGYRSFAEPWEMTNGRCENGNANPCALGEKCCRNNKQPEETLFDKSEFVPYDPSQEPIFPPELKESCKYDGQDLTVRGKNVTWFRPTSLREMMRLKKTHPEARIIVGNTEVGVEVKFKHFNYPVLIQPTCVPELNKIEETGEGLKIGASVTLQEMETAMRQQMMTKPASAVRIFAAVVDMLQYFAGMQIRNVAAVGGNIMTSSPISDLNPIFTAARCVLEVGSEERGTRTITMDETFFTGYRKTKIANDEILLSITVPFTAENQYFYAHKQARRRDDDIAIVNAAFNVTLQSGKIADIKLAFGGMAPTTVVAKNTERKLCGMVWSDESTLETAYNELITDLPLPASAPGGMIRYRRALTLSMFFRSYLAISQQLHLNIDKRDESAVTGFEHAVPKSSQYFEMVPDSQAKTDFVGRPIPHLSAFKQATGEAVYCDDMPRFEGELYMSLVLSTKSHANILSVDASAALEMDGVHAFFCADDLPHHGNKIGPVFRDEEIFLTKKVTSQGQIIGCIIADDQMTARKAVRNVRVDYEELSPVIVTIEDAIKHGSYFREKPAHIVKGDVEAAFRNSDFVVEGECRSGAQEHFYLETQCAIAVPRVEDDEMEIYCSTQHPSEISHYISEILEIPINRIVTKVKRMGGGFGGKESRSMLVAIPAAFAASRLRRPVRCMLDRDEDMTMTGTRHPFLMRYKASFNKDGKITGCRVHLYNNAGYSNDLSAAVMERAMFHFNNAYHIPNVEVFGYVCKTNLPSNTAFRGFGAPQAMLVAENIVRDMAETLKESPVKIARMNLFREGMQTHYNQEISYCTLERCWDECLNMAEYERRSKEIETFNAENRWKKRGIAVVPTKFGIAFTILFLNQGGALILVYTDGSVLLSHGGTEMGQGLHTKMIQIAGRVLGIPIEKIHVTETSTDKVPNTSPTAASASSDINGMAVKDACEKIVRRLEPYKKKNPAGTWEEWVKAAYLDRVSLSATGFHATPNIGYDFETGTGTAFNYFTYGVACSEVEIDCLTGDHRVLRTDIVMDLGESLNPAIDVGQVEGAFMQGYGLYVMEEMVYSPSGNMFTKGPGTYKLPGFGDIPIEFNVSLLKGAPNPRAIYSSKAVGEPPLFLASSVMFAIREAIKSARQDSNATPVGFRLDAPATAEKIRMGCVDKITDRFPVPEPGTFVPWNVTP